MPDRYLALAPRLTAAGLPPPSAATLTVLRDIVDESALGISTRVGLALSLIGRIATEGDDPESGFRAAIESAHFIAESPGAATSVVANALDWLLVGAADRPPDQRVAVLAERAAQWSHETAWRRVALVAQAMAALETIGAPLIVDYSSTVADIVSALADTGRLRSIIIPESRVVDGGRRFVETYAALCVPLRVVPDAAVDEVVSLIDCVLMGAESVLPDGSIVNTIGSVAFARAAFANGRPVYGCADLLKVATAAAECPEAPSRSSSCPARVEHVVETRAAKLEIVPASLVTAILTECGPLRPAEVAAAAADRRTRAEPYLDPSLKP